MARRLCSPACVVANIAVMKRSNTVNAQGLMPSTAAATTTVGRVILGRYICMASAGALGCHKPVNAIAPRATMASVERITVRRRGEVATILSFDNQLTVHGGVRLAATADITVEGIGARLLWGKGHIIGALGLGNDVHAKLLHGPLVLSSSI